MDKKRGKRPIWLRRLDLVAKQLRDERPLRVKAEERIDMALSLMAEGLVCLYERAEGNNRRQRKAATIAQVRDQMAMFRSLDADWTRRWRRERGRTFGG
ncbi:MAG: hypothetical protein ACE5JQ_03890 [Candidatus Methylomirabilales bacterium]